MRQNECGKKKKKNRKNGENKYKIKMGLGNWEIENL